MTAQYRKNSYLFYAVALAISLAGCAQQELGPAEICPPSANLQQAMEPLASRNEQAQPIRSNGSMTYTGFVDGKKKPRENLSIKGFRFYPPDRLYLRADSILGEELCVGMNALDFWLRIKTNPPSAYWFGRRDDMAGCNDGLLLRSESLLEAIGMIDVSGNWQLEADIGMDILIKTDHNGKAVKKIYIDRCSVLPKKIEYFGARGEIIFTIEMAAFTTGQDDIVVPAEIDITRFQDEQIGSIVHIKLTNIKLFEPTPAQLDGKLFKRPHEDTVKNVFELNKDCQFIRK
jgi:hypothetical protein